MSNSHALQSEARERQAWWDDAIGPYLVSGGDPATSVNTTVATFATEGYVSDSGELYYVSQATSTVGPLTGGDGTFWLALHRDRASTVAGWTREGSTHYLWQLSATQPATPSGAVIFAKLTVSASAITAVVEIATRRLLTTETVSANRTIAGLLLPSPDGLFSINTGITLTIQGRIEAGHQQIFSGLGDVDLTLARISAAKAEWFGIVAEDSASAVQTANITALRKAVKAFGELTVPTPAHDTVPRGGTIEFSRGTYSFNGTLTVQDTPFVVLKGQGTRMIADFRIAVTTLVYTASGTGRFIDVTTDAARGFRLEDIAIEYNNASYTGDLIRVGNTAVAGFLVLRSFIGTFATQSANHLESANSLIRFEGGERLWMEHSELRGAVRGVYAPNSGGAQTLAGLDIHACQFRDITTAMIDVESDGETWGWNICGNAFNPSTDQTQPTFGIRIRGNGWNISGNAFSASTATNAPSDTFVLLKGRGNFVGNNILSSVANAFGVRILQSSQVHFAGNNISADLPLRIVGGVVTGGGNRYDAGGQGGGIAVEIGDSGDVQSISVNIGPDTIESFTGNSYVVSVDNAAIEGIINYSPSQDASSAGPTVVSDRVTLKPINNDVVAEASTTTLTMDQTGRIISNGGAVGAVTYTLPSAVAGLEYFIYKAVNQNIQVDANTADQILDLDLTPATSISNTSAELGALIHLRAVDATNWLILAQRGTWA